MLLKTATTSISLKSHFEHSSHRRSKPKLEGDFFAACPSKPDLGVLGRKWALLILADVGLRRVDRFSGLLRSNPQLNSRNPEQKAPGARRSRHDQKNREESSTGTCALDND